MPGGFFWDTLRLLFEIKTAILKASHAGGIDSVGIDTCLGLRTGERMSVLPVSSGTVFLTRAAIA